MACGFLYSHTTKTNKTALAATTGGITNVTFCPTIAVTTARCTCRCTTNRTANRATNLAAQARLTHVR
jgi:hypothetical protein